MPDKRRAWTGAQIMAILKRHFVDKEDISKICQAEDIQPSQFYRWQAMLFEDGAAVFQRKNGQAERRELEAEQAKSAALEAKLQKKNEVLSELMEEHVRLKKELGES
jgi:transposase